MEKNIEWILVHALCLVNLAGHILLHGPIKFKVGFVAKLFHALLSWLFLTVTASESLKLSYTLNCVLKRTNDSKTISNWLVLLSRCVRNLKPFGVCMNRNHFQTRQTHNRDIIIISLILSSWSTLQVTDPCFLSHSIFIYGLHASCLGHKSKEKKVGPYRVFIKNWSSRRIL